MSQTRDVTQHPFIQALCKFEHSPKTNMAKRQVNNKDFIALCIFALGPLSSPELRKLADAWRSTGTHRYPRILDAYFIPHYGHTADSPSGARRYGGPHSSAKHVKYWWRCQEHENRKARPPKYSGVPEHMREAVPMQVFRNDLTQQGLARVRQLLQCPEAPLKELLPKAPTDPEKTREAVIAHVLWVLERETDEEFDAMMTQLGDLEKAGGVDTSTCDTDEIMKDPRILAALRKNVEGTIGGFQNLGNE